ncbi:MAG: DUF4834 family protein [Prevotellaceae bacterium]|nr:DUF4834 family protein [Prevotellaceae bacterium]MDY3365095.1 DUF4834 family protein [Prevotella sp.]
MFKLLLFLLFLIIIVPIILLLLGVSFLKRNIGAAQRMRDQYTNRQHNGGYDYNHGNNRSKDDIIIDRRSKEQAEQKIFDKNEGEYVDFTED